MIIHDMFLKPIDRDLKGVIKVEQDDEATVFQELDEYVVTKELTKHFQRFFSSYVRSIHAPTDKMGVWISGFFGSGKSHFLKILAYILENRTVCDRTAVSFFTDGSKISDNFLIGDIQRASQVSSEVILFNIDSKSGGNRKTNKKAILDVFVRVFNEHLGFCGSYPFVADLEDQLSQKGLYDQFTEEFEALNGKSWVAKRDGFYFIQDEVVSTLQHIGFMSEAAARNWCEKADENYVLSIEQFACRIREYCERRGKDHHIVFLVDEIGQYIGDDSQLMLNLQTLTEDLGTKCKGKAWVIVTSQQDIDAVTKVKGNDFSKIQGRFDTRLALSSANVGEVIRLRLLAKQEGCVPELQALYDEKESILKNLIVFSDGAAEMKIYAGRDDFSAVYPFIPYQFNLLGSVLKSIREHGASGKHLSEGERSMLGLFQDAAKSVMGESVGVLVSFDRFYETLHHFLDHSHASVILQAKENGNLEAFDVAVLKTLFMLKYVKELPTNTENLVTLLVGSVDEDRLALQGSVSASLKRLLSETLIQKNGNVYEFLTNEEQEVNRAIFREVVDDGEITRDVSEVIFGDILSEVTKASGSSNRYTYEFDRCVDGTNYKNTRRYELLLSVVTPANTDVSGEDALRRLSDDMRTVVVQLKGDGLYLKEAREELQIQKYLQRLGTGTSAYAEIREKKIRERSEKRDRMRMYLVDALQYADIFVGGEMLSVPRESPDVRVRSALTKLVETAFLKLSYMDAAPSSNDIANVLKGGRQGTLVEVETGKQANELAVKEIFGRIRERERVHQQTTLKDLQDLFTKIPYGYRKDDVSWIVAVLFSQNAIQMRFHGEILKNVPDSSSKIEQYLVKSEFAGQLVLEVREKISQQYIRGAKDLLKELYGFSPEKEEEDYLMEVFCSRTAERISTMKEYLTECETSRMVSGKDEKSGLPGKGELENGIGIFQDALSEENPLMFFRYLNAHKDELLDADEDLRPVLGFYEGEQKGIFVRGLEILNRFTRNQAYLQSDEELCEVATKIRSIVEMPHPYGRVKDLRPLLQTFGVKYAVVRDKARADAHTIVDEDFRDVTSYLAELGLTDTELSGNISMQFAELRMNIENEEDIGSLRNIGREESELVKQSLIERIQEHVRKQVATSRSPDVPVVPVQKKEIHVSLRELQKGLQMRLESPEDVEEYVSDMKRKLLAKLKEDSVLYIG